MIKRLVFLFAVTSVFSFLGMSPAIAQQELRTPNCDNPTEREEAACCVSPGACEQRGFKKPALAPTSGSEMAVPRPTGRTVMYNDIYVAVDYLLWANACNDPARDTIRSDFIALASQVTPENAPYLAENFDGILSSRNAPAGDTDYCLSGKASRGLSHGSATEKEGYENIMQGYRQWLQQEGD